MRGDFLPRAAATTRSAAELNRRRHCEEPDGATKQSIGGKGRGGGMDCVVPLASLGLLAMTAAPRFSKPFQGFPSFSKEIPSFSKEIPRKFQTFSLAVSRKIKGLSLNRPGIAFSPISARPRPQDGRPGDSLPGALTIQYTANSDFRKAIVGGGFWEGRRGGRGASSAGSAVDLMEAFFSEAERLSGGEARLRRRAFARP